MVLANKLDEQKNKSASIKTHLYVPVQIWDQLVLFMAHSTSEMCDTNICLLTIPKITLGDQYVTH